MALNCTPSNIPLSLYLHFPWCTSRCHYCDFNAHKAPKKLPERDYLSALTNQLIAFNHQRKLMGDEREQLKSIFIGGGTPSLVSSDLIAQSLYLIANDFDFENCEITLEANPESILKEKLKAYKQMGINRLSIGVQSFNQTHLNHLSRIHSSSKAKKAIQLAEQYFDNINVDLMYALHKQTKRGALEDIKHLLKFNINHISYYELTVEPNTFFYHHRPSQMSDDECLELQNEAIELFVQAGFSRYEISAYAQKNYQCEHNLNYWQFGDYLALGAGGACKISFPNQNSKSQNPFSVARFTAPKHPRQYINWAHQLPLSGSVEFQYLSTQDLIFEFFLNTSRLIQGFQLKLFSQRTGLDLSEIQTKLNHLVQLGLIEARDFSSDGQSFTPTKKGINFANEIASSFL